MKLTEHQLNEIELFQDAVREQAMIIEQLNACARNLDAAGIVVDFAMPTPIKVVHYVFKSVPILAEDIKAAQAERDAVVMAEADTVLSKKQPVAHTFGLPGRCTTAPVTDSTEEVEGSNKSHASWCMKLTSDSETCTCGIDE